MADKIQHIYLHKDGGLKIKFSVGGEGLHIEENKE
jgi:hypothetical protein